MNTGSEKPCSQNRLQKTMCIEPQSEKTSTKTIFCIDPLKKPSTQNRMPQKPSTKNRDPASWGYGLWGKVFGICFFFGYGFCDTVFSAHDFGIRFFGYGFLGPRIGFLWCKNPIFPPGSPCRKNRLQKSPQKKKNRVRKTLCFWSVPERPRLRSRRVFSGFGFLGMVFVGWFFRASDFRVWFFGQGFLSYGFSYTEFCVQGL